MMYDLQKASMWKRISAWLLDFILLVIVITGVAFAISSFLNYDETVAQYNALQKQYIDEYGVDLSVTQPNEEQLALRNEADEAFRNDPEAVRLYGQTVSHRLIIVVFSVLLAYVLLEFVVPLLFGNGQTVGKKIFGIAVMREDGVRLTPLALFARAILGKYTIETMLPIMLVLLMFDGTMGIIGTAVIAALLISQIILVAATKTNSAIHDKLAFTVAVDMASQMIFDTPEELLAYKKRMQAEKAEKAVY